MVLKELAMFAAAYWLTESRAKDNPRRMDWENIAGFALEGLSLAWQLLLLTGLGWSAQALTGYWPQTSQVSLGLTLGAAYGLSLVGRRPEGAAEPYFLALATLTLVIQHIPASSGIFHVLGSLASLWGGTLACAAVLLGLKDR
ncbi:MAG: hypothetical protein KBC91_04435, partial [Candidatus Omnitrophica bacterium]|nr:hypothetical protein [Candidatus Omnitrophota bacterium]